MPQFARILKPLIACLFCTTISISGATASKFALASAVPSTVLFFTIAANHVEARPRAGVGPRPGPSPGAAPRRHHYRDERRDFVRRRQALGFLYVVTRPCTNIVVLNDGVKYYYCDNVYYRPYIDNGVTIYVVRD